nr:MAG: movement protein [Artemisia fimovirus 1]
MLLSTLLLLAVCMFKGSSSDDVSSAGLKEINVSTWDNPLAESIDDNVLSSIINTELKKAILIKNKSQRLKINLYSAGTIFYKQMVNGFNSGIGMRCTEIVFSWKPMATMMGGLVTIFLVDTRQEGKDRIKGQVTFKPDSPCIAIFYQNYYVTLQDSKKLDFEVLIDGVNIKEGHFGLVGLQYKTVVGPITNYKPRDPIVFYIPVHSLPETEARTPDDIFHFFAKKALDKRQKELQYFQNLATFVDISSQPVNYLRTDLDEAKSTLVRKIKTAENYLTDIKRYKPDYENLESLEETLENLLEEKAETERLIKERARTQLKRQSSRRNRVTIVQNDEDNEEEVESLVPRMKNLGKDKVVITKYVEEDDDTESVLPD